MLAKFKKDLADSMTWQLLPLGATVPADAVQFMKVDRNATMVAEVDQFINELRNFMDAAQDSGGDMARVATVYDINMQSAKKLSSADLVVAVPPTDDAQIVVRKTVPNQTHPYPSGAGGKLTFASSRRGPSDKPAPAGLESGMLRSITVRRTSV